MIASTWPAPPLHQPLPQHLLGSPPTDTAPTPTAIMQQFQQQSQLSPTTNAPRQTGYEVSALVKDPEVSNKTWTLSIDKRATVAEVIYSFLMRRNGDVNQACQLRLMLGGQVLSDELDRTIEDCGVSARCLLHSMWRPSAGGCTNSTTCERCQKIAAAGQAASSPRKSVQPRSSMNTSLNNVEDEAAGGDLQQSEKNPDHGRRPYSKENRRNKEAEGDDTRTTRLKNAVDKTFKQRNTSPVQGVGTVELIAHLEKLVSSCGQACDVVGSLERLAKLHKHGALSDAEYTRAKSCVLIQPRDNLRSVNGT